MKINTSAFEGGGREVERGRKTHDKVNAGRTTLVSTRLKKKELHSFEMDILSINKPKSQKN